MCDPADMTESLVVGRVMAVLTGDQSRRYLPAVRLDNHTSHKRFQVEMNLHDRYVAVNLPSGQYRLSHVQIGEGPFMSMADVSMIFVVDVPVSTYVGTWRLGVKSPYYGRMIVVSVFADQAEAVRVQDFLADEYPALGGCPVLETLLQAAQLEIRLYEVMPYPRYPRDFRRH